MRDDAAARVRVVLSQRLRDRGGRQSLRVHARDVQTHFDRSNRPAETHDVGDAGNAFEFALQHPIFDQAEFIDGQITLECVTKISPVGVLSADNDGFDAFRKISVFKTLRHIDARLAEA